MHNSHTANVAVMTRAPAPASGSVSCPRGTACSGRSCDGARGRAALSPRAVPWTGGRFPPTERVPRVLSPRVLSSWTRGPLPLGATVSYAAWTRVLQVLRGQTVPISLGKLPLRDRLAMFQHGYTISQSHQHREIFFKL